MYTLIVVIHIIVSVSLVAIILFQVGKGASMSGFLGGGGSDALLSGAEGNVLIKKITAAFAIIFMVTTLSLVVLSAKRPKRSLMDIMPPAPTVPQDNAQAVPAAAGGEAAQATNSQPAAAAATK